MRDEQEIEETEKSDENNSEHQGEEKQFTRNVTNRLSEKRQSSMVPTETKAFQIGKETAEGEKKSIEIVDEDRPLEIDVNVTVGRGEELGNAFLLVVLPEQHSQR